MFTHDRTASIQRAAAQQRARDLRAEGTDLGRRLKEGGLGFDDCLAEVAVALELADGELPILPADAASSFTSKVPTTFQIVLSLQIHYNII